MDDFPSLSKYERNIINRNKLLKKRQSKKTSFEEEYSQEKVKVNVKAIYQQPPLIAHI